MQPANFSNIKCDIPKLKGDNYKHDNVKALLKAIDEQFVTSDKFSSLRLTNVSGVREHIMQMRDIAAQLKVLEVEMSDSFLVHFILNTLPQQYGPFKISYNTHKDKWSINELLTMCVQEEGRLKMELGENAVMTMKGKDQNQAKKKAKDDYSQYMYIYLLHNKNEALGAFKVFKAEVEKQCGKQIKIVRTDRGGEYYGRYTEDGQAPGPFVKFLQEHGIVAQYTMPGSLDQNGVAERRNRTLMDMVRSMRSNSKLPESLWTEALKTDIVFEKDHIDAQPSTSSDRLIVIQNAPSNSAKIVEQPVEQRDPQENVDSILRRSIRVRKPAIPSDYVVYLQELDYDIGAKNDPKTFSQAISCKESNLWYDAMKDKMNSMASNGVWNLVELPNGAKAIGCNGSSRQRKIHWATLKDIKRDSLPKGFTQNEGIDYKETFSLVSKKDSLRIIMTLVAHFDLELQQMDVKTTFLNGNLEEEVYMKQPEGFSSSGGEHLGLLHEVKQFLSKNFDMKDMGDATYVIGIKIQEIDFEAF
ncbi:Retrovirus-related Pol polyprotein from transposon TNT 1-94 [Vitis vinifera]|uniref:Retrovirus-related Pol polyprotein from transposon TNT 1-94 n=1 Tax=Vitis vinifera TaxID=29760 RepID=A0A438GRN1_VITVI|nr:Retrovirus-related Pol polyprotein from transposon TNT 1-94 [Vitis vinifera]